MVIGMARNEEEHKEHKFLESYVSNRGGLGLVWIGFWSTETKLI